MKKQKKPKSKIVSFRVFKKHIKEALPQYCEHCAVAVAIRSKLRPKGRVCVLDEDDIVVGGHRYKAVKADRKRMNAFISKFDDKKRVSPASFKIELVGPFVKERRRISALKK